MTNKTPPATTPATTITRSPITNKKGPKNHFTTLLLDGKIIDKLRVLSGAPVKFENEYAVWYSAQVFRAYVEGSVLDFAMPLAYYNIDQEVTTHTVNIQTEELYNTVGELTPQMVELSNNKTDNFTSSAKALVIYRYSVQAGLATEFDVDTYVPKVMGYDKDKFLKEIVIEIEAQGEEPIVHHLVDLGLQEDHPCISEKDWGTAYDLLLNSMIVQAENSQDKEKFLFLNYCEYLEELLKEAELICYNFDSLSDEEQKAISSKKGLVFQSIITHMNNFHAHPVGVNSFSGTDRSTTLRETYNATTGEYSYSGSAGILYPHTGTPEELNYSFPVYAGMVQSLDKKSRYIVNECRQYHGKLGEDYTYEETACCTVIIAEKDEVIPPHERLIGQRVTPQDYIIPYSIDVIPQIVQDFKRLVPELVDPIIDVEEDRVTEEVTTTWESNYGHYNYNYNYNYNKKPKPVTSGLPNEITYPTTDRMIEFLVSVGVTKDKARVEIENAKAKRVKLAFKKYIQGALFKTVKKNTMNDLLRVLNLFDVDFIDFLSQEKSKYVPIVAGFIEAAGHRDRYARLRENGYSLEEVTALSKDELIKLHKDLAPSTESSTKTKEKVFWDDKDNILDGLKVLTPNVNYGNHSSVEYLRRTFFDVLVSKKEITDTNTKANLKLRVKGWNISFLDLAEEGNSAIVKLIGNTNKDFKTVADIIKVTKLSALEIVVLNEEKWQSVVLVARIQGKIEKAENDFNYESAIKRHLFVFLEIKHIDGVGIYHSDSIEAVTTLFQELYLEEFEALDPKGNLKKILIDKGVNVPKLIEEKKYRDQVVKYNGKSEDTKDAILKLLDYCPDFNFLVNLSNDKIEEFLELLSTSVTEFTDMSEIHDEFHYGDRDTPPLRSKMAALPQIAQLEKFGIRFYKTRISGGTSQKALTSHNVDKAAANAVIFYYLADFTEEEITNIFKIINKSMTDLMDFFNVNIDKELFREKARQGLKYFDALPQYRSNLEMYDLVEHMEQTSFTIEYDESRALGKDLPYSVKVDFLKGNGIKTYQSSSSKGPESFNVKNIDKAVTKLVISLLFHKKVDVTTEDVNNFIDNCNAIEVEILELLTITENLNSYLEVLCFYSDYHLEALNILMIANAGVEGNWKSYLDYQIEVLDLDSKVEENTTHSNVGEGDGLESEEDDTVKVSTPFCPYIQNEVFFAKKDNGDGYKVTNASLWLKYYDEYFTITCKMPFTETTTRVFFKGHEGQNAYWDVDTSVAEFLNKGDVFLNPNYRENTKLFAQYLGDN